MKTNFWTLMLAALVILTSASFLHTDHSFAHGPSSVPSSIVEEAEFYGIPTFNLTEEPEYNENIELSRSRFWGVPVLENK